MRSINQKMTRHIKYDFRHYQVMIFPKTSKNKGTKCVFCKEIKIKTVITDINPNGKEYISLCKDCTGKYSLHLKPCKKRRMGFALLMMKGIL